MLMKLLILSSLVALFNDLELIYICGRFGIEL